MLAGCGGHHVLRALPGVAPSSSSTKPSSGTLRLVPETADPIPASVLAWPITGEARRFDGAVPPSGWMLAQGQTLEIADNLALYSILGRMAGGGGKTTFKLPNPGFGVIVAVAGVIPSNPSTVATAFKRRPQENRALAGMRPAPPRFKAIPKVSEESRKLMASAIYVGPSRFTPVSADVEAHIDRSAEDARTATLEQLGAGNRDRLLSLVAAVVAGTTTLYDATVRMASGLTREESSALLQINDARVRAFRPQWYGMQHENPQAEAGRFAISIGFTAQQLSAFKARQG